ncbi:MAG: hypothetical protein OXN89_11740, partial [Bryobacterales bacterium]|nr:hypothetical protein [Bryobacterales bacterium]
MTIGCSSLHRHTARRREVAAGLDRASPDGSRPGSPTPPPTEVAAMSDTNITAEHRRAFEALTSGRFDNFCLVSCFVDG